jgi:hypothetical protein
VGLRYLYRWMPILATFSHEFLCVAKLVKVKQAAEAAADAIEEAERAADELAKADAAFQRAMKRACTVSGLSLLPS